MKRVLPLFAVPLLVGLYFTGEHLAGRADASRVLRPREISGPSTLTLISRTHTLDRIYRSMQGPYGFQKGIRLAETERSELLWVTGVKIAVMDAEGDETISPEFFCHANLTLSEDSTPEAHNRLFGDTTHQEWRLFTLVPGRMEVSLPEGFGVPVLSNERLDFLSMSLNQNVTGRTVEMRFRTNVEFVRDADLHRPMKPLFRRAVYGYEFVPDDNGEVLCQGGDHPGKSCGPVESPGSLVADLAGSESGLKTMHWWVAPGEYESRTPATDQLALPFDTTVHYVTAHLHPYGVSLTLHDRTEGEDLFVLESRDFDDRLGVEHVAELSIPKGVTLYRDHDYELVTRYRNTTKDNIDAMAILYLYLMDREFSRPADSAAS